MSNSIVKRGFVDSVIHNVDSMTCDLIAVECDEHVETPCVHSVACIVTAVERDVDAMKRDADPVWRDVDAVKRDVAGPQWNDFRNSRRADTRLRDLKARRAELTADIRSADPGDRVLASRDHLVRANDPVDGSSNRRVVSADQRMSSGNRPVAFDFPHFTSGHWSE